MPHSWLESQVCLIAHNIQSLRKYQHDSSKTDDRTACTTSHLPLLCFYWASNCCCQSARRPQVGATLGFHLLFCLLHFVSKTVPGVACWFPWASRAGRLIGLKVACMIVSPLRLCRGLLIWKGLTGGILLPVCLSMMLMCNATGLTSAADHQRQLVSMSNVTMHCI